MTFRFVSNVDGADFTEATHDLDAGETLFVVASKTFTTLETMTNAATARKWLVDALGSDAAVAKHFVALSTNTEAVRKFGIDTANMFGFWDWVGGRYSMDSRDRPVHDDRHRPRWIPRHAGRLPRDGRALPHRTTGAQPAAADGPADRLVQQLLRCADARRDAVFFAYARGFPPTFSSCRWRATASTSICTGQHVSVQTGPIIWGEPGTDGQHSFYQLLHQGTKLVPCDFIGFCRPLSPLVDQHNLLMANLFAQAEALAFGKTAEELTAEGSPAFQTPFRVTEGNRPSNVILDGRPDPASALAPWSRCTSTACSPRARSGASTPTTSGASSLARSSRSGSFPNSPHQGNQSFDMMVRRTP